MRLIPLITAVISTLLAAVHMPAGEAKGSSPAATSTAASAETPPSRSVEPGAMDLRQLTEQAKSSPVALGKLGMACDSGDGKACYDTAMLFSSAKFGYLDWKKAAGYFQKGCDAGDTPSCRNAGSLYLLEKSGFQNLEKAAKYFQKGCDAGVAMDCVDTGLLYLSDTSVIKRENRRALELMKRACGLGDMRACYLQADIQQSISDPLVNSGFTLELFWKSCDGGYAKACLTLADYYSKASNLAREPVKGDRLYRQACFTGELEACKKFAQAELPRDAPPGSRTAYSGPRAAVYAVPDSNVFVVVASEEREGTAAEDEFLRTLVCEPGGRWESDKRTQTTGLNGIPIEVVTAHCSTSKRIRLFAFDISSYSGKP